MAHNRWAYCEAFAKEQAGPYTGKSSVRTSDDYFSGSIEPFVRSRGSFVRSEARLTVIGTEVALRRYRADHGSYPTDLRALTSTYLKTVPVDPFGQGRSLCYKAINGGKSFLLYSIGSDMKDDGGRFEGWTNMKSSGDIVAGKL
jgi:hypothetical protein